MCVPIQGWFRALYAGRDGEAPNKKSTKGSPPLVVLSIFCDPFPVDAVGKRCPPPVDTMHLIIAALPTFDQVVEVRFMPEGGVHMGTVQDVR